MRRRTYHPGKGWHKEPVRHGLAARGIRTVHDELDDGKFHPNHRSVAAMMRAKRIDRLDDTIERGHESLQERVDRLNAMEAEDERRLLEMYGRVDEIEGFIPERRPQPRRDQRMLPQGGEEMLLLPAGGVMSTLKKAGKKVASGAKWVGGKIKSGAKTVGAGAKKIGGKIKEGAKKVGAGAKTVGAKAKEWGGSALELAKDAGSFAGSKISAGGSWLRKKIFSKSKDAEARREQAYNIAGDNLADQMSIDTLLEEQERLDRSNRAMQMTWATKQKWVDYRWDNLERKKRLMDLQKKKQRLLEEMYR